MNKRLAPQTITLSAAQLGLFLRNAGPLGPLSPVSDFNAMPSSPEDVSLLAAAGLIDAKGLPLSGWRTAADTLARPASRLVVSAGDDTGFRHLQMFAGQDGDETFVAVGLAPGERISLAWPVGPLEATMPLFAALALDGATFDPEVRLELTPEGFLMLAAALDALRERELEALLTRDSAPALLITNSAIKLALKTGASSTDMRWLGPIFHRLLPRAPEMTSSAIEHGLAELVAAAILTADDTQTYGLVASFEPVRRLFAAPLGWGAVTVGKANPEIWSALGAFRTFNALWGVETLAGKVRIGTIGETALVQAFIAVVASAAAPTSGTPDPTTAAARYCPHCGIDVKAVWAFCGSCGKPLPPESLARVKAEARGMV